MKIYNGGRKFIVESVDEQERMPCLQTIIITLGNGQIER